MFSEKEIEYLKTQRLARIGTVSSKGQVDVAPVAYEFDGKQFFIGGRNMIKTKKYWNVKKNKKIALVVDDLETVDPWKPRGIKIHGTAELIERQGRFGSGSYIRFIPEIHWSWGVEEPVFVDGKYTYKKIKHENK
ncbi:MAG: PPOX class F420-dependent oxidoreductase [Promethearchaeota archaeon]